jgi:hypothetical protein
VPKVPAESTSYAHRNSIYEWQLVDAVSDGIYPNDVGIAWLNPFVSDIEAAEPNITFGMYYNYADPTLGGGKAAGHRYWLQHYDRLVKIKKGVDPGLLFLNPQTVGN